MRKRIKEITLDPLIQSVLKLSRNLPRNSQIRRALPNLGTYQLMNNEREVQVKKIWGRSLGNKIQKVQACQVQINMDPEDQDKTKGLCPISSALEVQGQIKALEVPDHNNQVLEGQVLFNKDKDPQLQGNMDKGGPLLNSRVIIIKVKMKWVPGDLINMVQEDLVQISRAQGVLV